MIPYTSDFNKRNPSLGRNRIKAQRIHSFLFFLVIVLFSCGKDEPEERDYAQPVFSACPVNIADFDSMTGRCGDVTSVMAYGEALGPERWSPAIEYYTLPDAGIYSVCPGYVSNIFQNPGMSDYEVWVKPSVNSVWLIIYDHVQNLEVAENQTVNPGDLLGTAGEWSADTGRTELGINNYEGSEISFCPLLMGTPEFNRIHEDLFQQLYNAGVLASESVCLEQRVIP